MENNPYKVIYCVKNNNKVHQYYHYIFLGNINNSLKSIINKFKDLSLSETIGLLTKKEIDELKDFYGDEWFKYFFNKEHIDFSFSTSNPKLMQITSKLNIELFYKKEYKPQFTYGFNTQRGLINTYLKKNKFVMYGGNEDMEEEREEQRDEERDKNEMNVEDEKNDSMSVDNDNDSMSVEEEDETNDETNNSETNDSEMNFSFNLDDIIEAAKENEKIEINQSSIDRILNDRNNDIVSVDIDDDTDEEKVEDNMSKKEYNELQKDIKQTEKIVSFKEYEFDKSKDDIEYEDNLYNSFNKIYIYDLYINSDDTIKEIKNKISLSIKNKSIYQNQNILPSRMHLWIRWLVNEEKEKTKKQMEVDKYNSLHFLVNSSHRKEEDICLGNLWLENNGILHYSIKPFSSINIYANISKEVQELNEKLNKSTIRIMRKNLENNILSSMSDYLENNDIFMIDIYNELNYLPNLTEEQLLNLQNIFLKIYFPDVNINELKQIIAFTNNGFTDTKNIDGEKEAMKIENEYDENYLESSLSFKIENIYHDVFNKKKTDYTNSNHITQVQLEIKLQSPDLLRFQRLELYKIFDNFNLNKKYIFTQYTQFNNDSIFKFDEETIDYLIKEKDLYVNILKWFNSAEYGLNFRINYNDNYIPANVFIDVVGRMIVKFYWKEEDEITTDKIKDFYYVVRELIEEINKIIESKIIIPSDEHFHILFMTSLEKFKLSNKKEINHNDLSNFSRLFYPYFSLVIEPKKRKSNIDNDKDFSKYGTYLRYKRINDYENINKIENRIKYYIKFVDISNKELINEISKQFNLTIQKAQYYYEDVINKYPNIKKNTKRLKSIGEVGKDKMDGIDIGIQGKNVDNYKIRLSGVRNIEQMNDINNIINTLLFLYDEIYIKKTIAFKYLLDLLNKIKNIAERRNFVSDFVNYESGASDIKQMQSVDNVYVGYDTGKGIAKHSRICQNSGKENRRRPLQFTDDNIGELLKKGYKMNNSSGMYEKRTKYNGKDITLRVVKLKGNNNSSIYYTCSPEHNGRHTYIGFLTKGKNPFGKYPPCCFRTDAFISNNKEKQKFNFNQLKDVNEGMKRERELSYNETYYILSDIIKVPDGRLANLPDILEFFLNTNNKHSYKIIQHILSTTNSYYFKMGCGDELTTRGKKFVECVSKSLDKDYDDVIAECIIALNKNKSLFQYLNNGEIKFYFVDLENYINYIKSGEYGVNDIIHLLSVPGVIDKDGLNIHILEKVYANSEFKWDIKYKYLNNEDLYDRTKNIFIIEQDDFFTLIVNVIKDKKDGVINKYFDNESDIIKTMKIFFNENHNYHKYTAKDIYANVKDIIGQSVDVRNKCNYVIHKNGLIVPVINGGIVLDLDIINIDKYIKSYDETMKLINDYNKNVSKEYSLNVKFLIYDSYEDKKYCVRGIGINKETVIPIKKYYITNSNYQLINQPSYSKLDKLIQDKEIRKEIKKDDRIKIVNAMKYKNEAYELFRYNLCYFFKDEKSNNYREKILTTINDNISIEEKVEIIRKMIYEIINNEKANKFYYNKTKDKIVSKNKPLIYVYSKIELDDYEINNNRTVSEIKNKLQCTSKHEFYEDGRCLFSLSINLLIEFINKLTYELIGNELKRFEVLRINGYKVSSIVDENFFTNKKNEKMLKRKANDDKNPFMDYYKSQDKYIPHTKKIYKEKKRIIENNIKPFKQNGKMNQPVFDTNKHLRAIVNCIYYYQNKINLGYYNSLQDTLIKNLIGNIINYVQEKSNYSLGGKEKFEGIEDIYTFIINIINNSDMIDYKLLYQIVSDIYQLNINVINNNEKVLFSTGKSNQLTVLMDDGIVANVY